MTKSVSDDDVETALTTWAYGTVATTTAQPFDATDTTIARPGQRAARRYLIAALAAATVLLVTAVGVAIRERGNGTEPPATGESGCPTSLPTTFRTDAPPLGDGRPIFTGPVAAMTACSYQGLPSPKSHLVAAVPLGQHMAETLARHLNDAAITNEDRLLCQAVPNISLLLARDDHGHALAPVKLIPGCRQITVTNGATTRFLNVDDLALQAAETYVRKHS